jgi:hypothetical protein
MKMMSTVHHRHHVTVKSSVFVVWLVELHRSDDLCDFVCVCVCVETVFQGYSHLVLAFAWNIELFFG